LGARKVLLAGKGPSPRGNRPVLGKKNVSQNEKTPRLGAVRMKNLSKRKKNIRKRPRGPRGISEKKRAGLGREKKKKKGMPQKGGRKTRRKPAGRKAGY